MVGLMWLITLYSAVWTCKELMMYGSSDVRWLLGLIGFIALIFCLFGNVINSWEGNRANFTEKIPAFILVPLQLVTLWSLYPSKWLIFFTAIIFAFPWASRRTTW